MFTEGIKQKSQWLTQCNQNKHRNNKQRNPDAAPHSNNYRSVEFALLATTTAVVCSAALLMTGITIG